MKKLNTRYCVNFALPLLCLALAGFLALLLTQAQANHNTAEAMDARTAPVGKLNVLDEGTVVRRLARRTPQDAATVYRTVCAACHGTGIAGAPRTGDRRAWNARIRRGNAALVRNAINGYQGEAGLMPARGGNPNLSDEEVRAAVEYMVRQSR